MVGRALLIYTDRAKIEPAAVVEHRFWVRDPLIQQESAQRGNRAVRQGGQLFDDLLPRMKSGLVRYLRTRRYSVN